MSEETTGQNQQPDPTPAGQQSKDLANELRELGHQLEQTFRTMIQSDQAKSLKENLSLGLQEIGKQVQAALKSIQESPKVQQLAERGQQAIHQAQESQQYKEFQETLVNGIGQLNDKLADFVQKLETRSSATSSGSPPQQVPVEDASQPPATGETQRLDS